MLGLADMMTTPPGGWKFKVEETGETISAPDYGRLLLGARTSLERAGLMTPLDYETIFQDQLCRQNPHTKCEVTVAPTNETRQIKAGDVLRFLKVMASWAGAKGATVPQEEADRRAEICAGCPYNVTAAGCSACMGIASKVAELTDEKKTRFDAQLENCGVCGCSNKAQVWLPLEVLKKGITPDMDFPEEWCWKVAAQSAEPSLSTSSAK